MYVVMGLLRCFNSNFIRKLELVEERISISDVGGRICEFRLVSLSMIGYTRLVELLSGLSSKPDAKVAGKGSEGKCPKSGRLIWHALSITAWPLQLCKRGAAELLEIPICCRFPGPVGPDG